MADNEFQVEAIGEVYAQALINEATKQNALPQVTEEVRGIGTLFATNETFKAFCLALAIGQEERLAAIDKIFKGRVHELTLNTLRSLAMRDRFMFLGGMVEGFEAILKKMSGRVDLELTSAMEMRPDAIERIRLAVGKSVGQDAMIETKVRPELIGGMTLRVGDTLIDASVATQLAKIEELLKNRGINALQGKLSAVIG